MKTFKDLEFKPHRMCSGLQAKMLFPNGYGVSVVRFKIMGERYGSHTSNEDEWELAVIKGDEEHWEICYVTPITDDVLGYLSDDEVTEVMKKVQEL